MATSTIVIAPRDANRLEGRRQDGWSLTVTRNERLTFSINDANEIVDLDDEDHN